MEQVLAPNVNFKSSKAEKTDDNDIIVKGYKKPSKKVQDIINELTKSYELIPSVFCSPAE